MNTREAKRQYTRALRLCSQAKYEQAHALLDDLVRQSPDDVNVLTAFAFCLAHLRRSAEAKAIYRRLAQEFNDPGARRYLQALESQTSTVVPAAPGMASSATPRVLASPARNSSITIVLVAALAVLFLVIVFSGIVLVEMFNRTPQPTPQWAQDTVSIKEPLPAAEPVPAAPAAPGEGGAVPPPQGHPQAAMQTAQQYAAAQQTYRPQRTPVSQAPPATPQPWHPLYVAGSVYVQSEDPCFHRHNCPLLSPDRLLAPMTIEAASARYAPCPCMEFESLRDTAFWIWRGEGPLFTDSMWVDYTKWAVHWLARQEGEIHISIVDADTEQSVAEGHAVAPGGGSCMVTRAGSFRLKVDVNGPVLYFLKAEGLE